MNFFLWTILNIHRSRKNGIMTLLGSLILLPLIMLKQIPEILLSLYQGPAALLFLVLQVLCCRASGAEPPSTALGCVSHLGQLPNLEDQVMPAPFGEICVGGPMSRSEQGKSAHQAGLSWGKGCPRHLLSCLRSPGKTGSLC